MHAIVSRDGRKLAEAGVDAAGGRLRLGLRGGGEEAWLLDEPLERLLTFSEGTPWQTADVSLEDVYVCSSGEEPGLRISAVVNGLLRIKLELTFDDQSLLRLQVSWKNISARTLTDAALGLLLPLPKGEQSKVTIPHMLYNDNPSSDPQRIVPKLGRGHGRGVICEEHRLPIPGVNVEWQEGMESEGTSYCFTLFSVPSCSETEEGTVRYGSLGAIEEENGIVAAALSGVVMFNGEKDVVCTAKSRTDSWRGGYQNLAPGETLAKDYAFDWSHGVRPGRGFRAMVRQALHLYDPRGAEPLSTEEIVRLKTNALDGRWRSGGRGEAGYVKFAPEAVPGRAPKHPPHFMYGWTGQGLKLAWCDLTLGLRRGEEQRITKAVQAADFYLHGSRTEVPGLRRGMYDLAEGRWDHFRWNGEEVVPSRALGETIADLADLALLLRGHGREIPAGWTEAVREAADWFRRSRLPSGVYPAAWRTDGTPADSMVTAAGLPCTIALAKAYRVGGDAADLIAAEAGLRSYYEAHAASFDRPFARSTLDARCEDKEAGMYFFLAAYELYTLTGRDEYREWAEIGADWILTFVFHWNPVYDRGTPFRDQNFLAAGWPGVSVQNHHLDVYFPTYELWKFGRMTGRPDYERIGRMSFSAMGQGICTQPGEYGFSRAGEQGEGFFQTNWNGRGHSNTWNPSWVIALVLQNALRFREEEGG
ncbi:hypothetical protein ACVNS2_21520 [Paenibacillus caseinilyticus]|uniref:Uncharacterized protein n=1 Tax=Paenibacillus mucilaginosus K02 TaxID=997761 RepID=I0BLJ6_9BACL|nr:hypothetical protein [Paenibacillus mucilaginosus]AFH63243.1 hypothetical protein B2K_21495 [Paenibacillus mucilaginosus K02]